MNRTRQMKRYGLLAGVALAGIVWVGNTVQAADMLIAPVAATAESYYSAGADNRSPGNAINGAGMTPNAPVIASSTAGNTAGGAMWLSNNKRQTWITFDLGSVRTLTGFRLWNYNEWGIGGTVEPYRGVQNAGVYTGTSLLTDGSSFASGGAAWGTLVTNMTFTRAGGTVNAAGIDYIFAAPVTSRYVQLYVTNNFHATDAYTGISEIRFYASPPYTVTSSSSSSAYSVSGTDLLQTKLSSTADLLSLNNFGAPYINGGAAALTDGLFGPANSWEGSCQVAGGLVTYFLNTADHPAGYTITNINTYSGWKDSGRRNQNYTVSFRKAGAETFGDVIAVSYAGTENQTSVSIRDLDLTGVGAVRFTFPAQQNGGVGYKEFDVFGAAPNYVDVTRLDSGTKVITNNAASDVRIIEGSGALGNLTLEATTNTIRSLTQSTIAGLATVSPAAGQVLVLDRICQQADAGGLTIAAGTLMTATETPLAVDNRSTNGLTVNAVIADRMFAVTDLYKAGVGTLKLNGTNTYSGVTVFGDGVIDIATLSNYGSGGSLGKRVSDSFGNVGLLFHGGTLRYSGATAQRTDRAIRINADGGGGNTGGATLDASGSVPAATFNFLATASPDFFEWSGTRTLTLTGSNSGNNIFAMAIGEAGGATRLVKSGSGTWVLAGANAYSGATRIEGGTLKGTRTMIAPIDATAQSWYTTDNRSPGTAINGAGMTPNPVRDYSTAGNATANAMWLSANTKQTWITFDLGSVRTITGFRLWNYNENKTFELNRGVRTAGIYTGTNLLASGSLYSSAGAAWGTLVTNMTFVKASGTVTDTGTDYTFAAPVTSRYLQLYVTDNFPGADAYTGISEIRFYDLNSSDNAFLPSTTAINLTASGATLILGRANQTVVSLTGVAGSSVVNDGILTVNGNNSSNIFAGVISGAGSYVKTGSSKQTFSGANTYGGATTVSAGTLEITQSDALPSSTALEIASTATLLLNNAGEQQVTALTFDNVPQYRGITWGGPLSDAQRKSSRFAGTGILRALTGPAIPGTMISFF